MTHFADHLRTTALLDLVECCEKAAGPSRHLDTQIFILLDPDAEHIIGAEPGRFPQKPIYGPRSSFWEWALDESKEPPEFGVIPAYTASLDAAMTLVKPEWWVNVSGPMSPAAYGYSREDERRPRAGVEMIGHPYSAGARAATHALALTAACLRALAAQAIEARRDSGSRAQREDPRSGAEAEGRQSGAEGNRPISTGDHP
jgi:hypothetical protein